MICKKIIDYLEDWAPKETAWKNDNAGLQVGRSNKKLKNIMLSLELTSDVLNQAIKKNCNLVITHHPLIFQPLKNLNFNSNQSANLIEKLIKFDITYYAVHTNLDFTKYGVSFQLAKKIGLKNITFLKNLQANQYKLVVFVPKSHVEKVADAIFNAGGGIIGEYSNCSFRTSGEGTFLGSHLSHPAVGLKNINEKVDEIRLEILINEWKLNEVLNALKKTHPYEEPAFDVYRLENKNVNFGAGAIGIYTEALSQDEFLHQISQKLRIKNYRFVSGASNKIRTVAVCGGSGADLISEAIFARADAFITADLKYHTFQSAAGKILLIDAGHYETEIPVLDELQKRLRMVIGKKERIKVLKFNGSTNPINIYNKIRSHVN